MDYLRSVMDNLEGTPSPRNLKYAVLHLQAATEVLLKARLTAHDWKLVFTRPDKADRGKFERGEFHSCGVEKAIERLSDDVGISIPDTAKTNILRLADQRNALQHYGLTSTTLAVESRAVPVLDFLLDFVSHHLRPGLAGDEATHVDEEMASVREELIAIQALVDARLQRIEPDLQAAVDRTVECPACGYTAMIASGDHSVECLLCGQCWKPEQAAEEYAELVVGLSWYQHHTDDGGRPVISCPECDLETVVCGATVAGSPDTPGDFCFNCAYLFSTLVPCENSCGTLVDRDSDLGLCPSCEGNDFARF
ncbi:hypothetical protein AB0G74_22015 [Streptomyces sp. NPDC020875]|uniref:hypothetical protein n=1 Tax=Streptomyces sp. NPDC020875 TaxID=3154898 RepID=UPI0033E71B0C